MQSINSRRIHRLQSCARAPQLVLRVLVLRVLGSVLVVLCGRVCGRVGVLVLCGRIGVLVLGVVLLRRILRRFGSLYICIYIHTHTCVCVCVCVSDACIYQIYTHNRCIPGLAKCRSIAAQASTGQTGQPQQWHLPQLGTVDTGLWGTLASAVIIIKTEIDKR